METCYFIINCRFIKSKCQPLKWGESTVTQFVEKRAGQLLIQALTVNKPGLSGSDSWQITKSEGRDIKGIYLTHWHSDHAGAAGWLQQLSGAPVFISVREKDIFQKYWDSDFGKIVETHIRNAMPQECVRELFEEHKYWIILTEPYPQFTSIKADETVQLGDFQYSSILTPGHSDGHMCFFNKRFGVLLSGDHLLPNITPNIGSNAFSDSDLLGNFLQSLLAISHLDCQLVLPAHGEPFANSKKRILTKCTHFIVKD